VPQLGRADAGLRIFDPVARRSRARPPDVALRRDNLSNDSTSAAQDLEGTALDPRQAELLADLAARTWPRCSAPTLPTDPEPLVEFVKIDMSGQHQQAGSDEFFASLFVASKPGTREPAGALDADIVAALCYLAEVIN
jgi:hypothetical protein